jgi:hypothetical protein
MRITTRHSRSSYGIPVILDDRGQVMDQVPGLAAVLARLGWTRADLAARTGNSPRTVEAWFQGVAAPAGRVAPRRPVPAEALNVLRDALEARGVGTGG